MTDTNNTNGHSYELDALMQLPTVQDLPTIEEILFAISDVPLGEGEEAKVYKVHPKPLPYVSAIMPLPLRI